eukprot:TRINITY_DN97256_c0_g1_i1.p1 TRINITY_DN97256_c0_g1~~TRINITY_DN97256_c0_g1_i1.p1  ORF type:complete len:236 (+),score=35.03 TRINITY_DN97256_c0_g1_i1:41-748(+)
MSKEETGAAFGGEAFQSPATRSTSASSGTTGESRLNTARDQSVPGVVDSEKGGSLDVLPTPSSPSRPAVPRLQLGEIFEEKQRSGEYQLKMNYQVDSPCLSETEVDDFDEEEWDFFTPHLDKAIDELLRRPRKRKTRAKAKGKTKTSMAAQVPGWFASLSGCIVEDTCSPRLVQRPQDAVEVDPHDLEVVERPAPMQPQYSSAQGGITSVSWFERFSETLSRASGPFQTQSKKPL